MRRKTVLLAVTAMLMGCGGATQRELGLKCSFAPGSTTSSVPGEAFLYVLRGQEADPWRVVHGIARGSEPLDSRDLSLQRDLPLLTARPTTTGLEWTERDSTGAEVTNWIASWEHAPTGEVFIHFGVSHLSSAAYPACFAHAAF